MKVKKWFGPILKTIRKAVNNKQTWKIHTSTIPDHLGPTSYITDNEGNITQYDAYLLYGELLVNEHSSTEDMPYKFNGEEMDDETGLYYYGTRNYEPRVSLWIN